jgi:hypothetical protein
MPRKRTLDIALVAGAVLLVAVLAALRGTQTAPNRSVPSTYDTGVAGYAALYDLLAGEGVRVDRFERPIGELSPARDTLVIAGQYALDAAAPSQSARGFLDRWIRRGGTLVVLGEPQSVQARTAFGLPAAHKTPQKMQARAGCAFTQNLRGLPAAGTFTMGYDRACSATRRTVLQAGTLAAATMYRRGHGSIVLAGTPEVFDNLHISQASNARLAYALFGGARSVLFDERAHGYAAGRSFWQVLPPAMRVAVVLALCAIVLAIAGANLPFAPPYTLQRLDERDSGQYIAAVARMLERGGAAREAIGRISSRCEPILKVRPGDERARMLLRELRILESTPRPGAHEVLAAGRIFARVRKEYGC